MSILKKIFPWHVWDTAQGLQLNPVTLSFASELEKEFQDDYYRTSLIFLRISFLAGILFYSIFLLLDLKVAGDHLPVLLQIRFIIVCPVIFVIFLLSFTKNFYKYWQQAILFAMLVAGCGIIFMLIGAPGIIQSGYYPGLILVLIYGYFLIKLRFIYASICGIALITLYLSADYFLLEISANRSFNNAFFLITTNIALMLGSYFIEYYTRRDFFYRFLLDIEQQTVAEINVKLEKMVTDRTKQIEFINSELREKIDLLKISQKELQENEEQLRLAFDASNATIWGIYLINEKLIMNEVGIRLLNYPTDQLTELENISALHPEDRDTLRDALAQIKEGKSSQIDLEFRMRSWNGSWKWLHAWGKVAESDSMGNPLSLVGTLIDISSRKQNEIELQKYRDDLENIVQQRTENLESSQKALVCLMEDMNLTQEELTRVNKQLKSVNEELESFSYSVSHDLRSPLRAIDGFSRALLEDYKDELDQEGKEYIDLIHQNVVKMNQLIKDLLEFSRLGRKMLNPVEIDFTKLFQQAFDTLTVDLPKRKFEFEMAEIPPVKADHNLMRQVVLNLLSNAVKFTGKNAVTRILVGYYQKDEQHVIFVKDNGVGFDMNYASKLFGVFQRLHSDHDFEGLGVGLSLVKRIITRHNGKIWAESEVDKGATFFFSIPLEKTKSKDGEIKNDE